MGVLMSNKNSGMASLKPIIHDIFFTDCHFDSDRILIMYWEEPMDTELIPLEVMRDILVWGWSYYILIPTIVVVSAT